MSSNPTTKTALGTPYTYLKNHELVEIGRLDQIRSNLSDAFCNNCCPSILVAASASIRDGIDEAFKAVAARLKDIETIADIRRENEQERERKEEGAA